MSVFAQHDTKAIGIPQVFSEDSRAKNALTLQFLLFPEYFISFRGYLPTFKLNSAPTQTCVFDTSLLKTVRKKEIAHNKKFFLLPQCFLAFWRFF